MSVSRRFLLAALAGLFSAPALARPHPRHPHTVPLSRDSSGADGPAHATRVARRRHPARSDRIAETRPPRPNLPLVVIDAGHGGHDPGAIGRSGTLEKNVALATALELGRQLRGTRRYRVLFTRDRDIFVPLPARLRTIARSGAALLVSIHADAAASPGVRGASVYVRSPGPGGQTTQFPAHRGAAPAMAEALAGPPPGSELLQLTVVGRLDDDLRMTASPARRAQLYVLAAANVPGVLVEMGYISSPKDEVLLQSQRHRATIARAIRDAVDQYFVKAQGRRGLRT